MYCNIRGAECVRKLILVLGHVVSSQRWKLALNTLRKAADYCLKASSAFDLQFPTTKQTPLLWSSRTSSTAKRGTFAGTKIHRFSAPNTWDPLQFTCVSAVELPSSNHACVHAMKARPGMYNQLRKNTSRALLLVSSYNYLCFSLVHLATSTSKPQWQQSYVSIICFLSTKQI